MSKYLVTGITGFAAPHLAQLLLNEGHEVHGLTRATSGRETDLLDLLKPSELNSIKFQKADLLHYARLAEIIKENQYHGVFHCAAQSEVVSSFHDPIMTFQDNVIGSVNLITAIEKNSPETYLMAASTSEVYGDQCKDTGILYEDDHLKPVNPYACSKAAMDLYMQERLKNKKIKGFITRAFSHTGSRRFKNFSISSDAYQLATMHLKSFDQHNVLLIGNLNTQRVVIDVRDCVRAYYLLMETIMAGCNVLPQDLIFNVCGTQVHKMQYFTDQLIKISGLTDVEQKIHPPFYRDIDIQVQIGDCKKLEALTGWEPVIPIERTMQDLFDYWVKKLR
jgi:GDP-4-dehydro-6-deoxy-D-mannose reductase